MFHIANQDYTYPQAKCKCEAYNAKLATKNQVIDAYNKGANWCNYGWSEGQSAYYPIQKCYWDKLQEHHTKDKPNKKCGNPGVNGGFFASPHIKFGANCFGIKPKGRVAIPKKPYCPKPNFCDRNKNYQAAHKLATDEVSPFNKDTWSAYNQ